MAIIKHQMPIFNHQGYMKKKINDLHGKVMLSHCRKALDSQRTNSTAWNRFFGSVAGFNQAMLAVGASRISG